MKITEKTIRQSVMSANAHSKHTGLGLKATWDKGCWTLQIIQRANGFVSCTFFELSARECNTAALMFANLACLTKPAALEG